MYTIYLVPHTHYDAVWAFTEDDYTYINEIILEKAVELARNSDYKFHIEQIYLLQRIEEINPKLWSDIKDMIQQKKFEIVDGQYLMPDAMLPDGEVLVREIVTGKRYCKEKFGIDVPVAWAADGFGLNAQIPQMYKKAGYKWIAFRRGASKMISEFKWKGIDGTTILAHWMPLGYRAGLNLDSIEGNFKKLKKVSASSHILMPSGSGVTIPQKETSQFVKKWNRTHNDVKIKITTASEFFKALESEKLKLETIKGAMYSGRFSEVFPDVCSSRIWIILNVRKCENLLLCAERFATISWLHGTVYPEIMLNKAWNRMLFIAFHDVLPGTSIDDVYYPVKEHFVSLERDLNKVLTDSFEFLTSKIDTEGEGVVVFNPLNWTVTNWVEAEVSFERGTMHNPGLQFEEETECEILESWRYDDGSTKRARIGFVATVPAFGYRVYKIVERKKYTEKIMMEGNVVQNRYFKLKVDHETGIVEVKLKKTDLTIKGNELVIDDESGDLYYHQSRLPTPIKTEGGGGLIYGDFKPKSFKVEEGVTRTRIIFENEFYTLRWPYRLLHKYNPLLYRHKAISCRKEIIIYRDIPRIDFVTTLDNKYPGIRIRVKFDTNIKEPKYMRGTQFGAVQETTTDNVQMPRDSVELFSRAPAINWVDYSDSAKGLAVINHGNPENELRTGSIYITLLRSIYALSVDGQSGPMIPTPDALEIGQYTFRYSLYPHKKDWKHAKSHKQSLEFSRGLFAMQANSKGALPQEYSFLNLYPDNLVLSTLKKAEDSNDAVLRFYETLGEKTVGIVGTSGTINNARKVNLLEEDEPEKKEPLKESSEKGTLSMPVKPFEIVGLKLNVDTSVTDE